MIDYSLILAKHYAGKNWALQGEDYTGLTWTDESPKPTQSELDALWVSTQDNIAKTTCKDEAKKRIAATDWAVLPDVGLANKTAFETYRATLRELIKNPVAEPTWPTEPEPIWS
jgi:hypothetical protein